MKFLIVLSSALSAQAVFGVSLSSLLVANNTTPSLLIDSSFHQESDINASIIDKVNNTKLKSNLSDLFNHKIVSRHIKSQFLIISTNECRPTLVNKWENATYRQSFQQQSSVYSAIKAQQNSCFQSQTSYQAERQKIALQLS